MEIRPFAVGEGSPRLYGEGGIFFFTAQGLTEVRTPVMNSWDWEEGNISPPSDPVEICPFVGRAVSTDTRVRFTAPRKELLTDWQHE